MEKTFIFAGFGGQGMLLIGKFMAMACMLDGKHVSWLPSYGPEMRGGTANCSVIVSDNPVASPLVNKADVVVAMNRPSLDKFEEHVKPGGVLVINSSIIDRKAVRDDITVVYCDANNVAESVKNPKGANVAILGAVLEKVPVTTVDQMMEAISRATRRLCSPVWRPRSNSPLFITHKTRPRLLPGPCFMQRDFVPLHKTEKLYNSVDDLFHNLPDLLKPCQSGGSSCRQKSSLYAKSPISGKFLVETVSQSENSY